MPVLSYILLTDTISKLSILQKLISSVRNRDIVFHYEGSLVLSESMLRYPLAIVQHFRTLKSIRAAHCLTFYIKAIRKIDWAFI